MSYAHVHAPAERRSVLDRRKESSGEQIRAFPVTQQWHEASLDALLRSSCGTVLVGVPRRRARLRWAPERRKKARREWGKEGRRGSVNIYGNYRPSPERRGEKIWNKGIARGGYIATHRFVFMKIQEQIVTDKYTKKKGKKKELKGEKGQEEDTKRNGRHKEKEKQGKGREEKKRKEERKGREEKEKRKEKGKRSNGKKKGGTTKTAKVRKKGSTSSGVTHRTNECLLHARNLCRTS